MTLIAVVSESVLEDVSDLNRCCFCYIISREGTVYRLPLFLYHKSLTLEKTFI